MAKPHANDPVAAAIRALALEAFEHGRCSSAKRPFDSDLSPEAWAKKLADEAAKQAAKVVAAEQALLHAIALHTFPLWLQAKESLATLRYIGERDAKGVFGLLARSHVGSLGDAIARFGTDQMEQSSVEIPGEASEPKLAGGGS